MKKLSTPIDKLSLLVIGLATVVGLAACSDNKLTLPGNTAVSSNRSPAGGSATSDAAPGNTTDATADAGPDQTALTIPDLSDLSIPGLNGVSIPDLSDLSIPGLSDLSIPALPDECLTFTKIYASVFSGSTDVSDISAEFSKLESQLPDNLQDDAKVLEASFTKLQAVYTKYKNDYSKIVTDPEALAVFSDPKFSEALGNVDQFFSEKCSGGS